MQTSTNEWLWTQCIQIHYLCVAACNLILSELLTSFISSDNNRSSFRSWSAKGDKQSAWNYRDVLWSTTSARYKCISCPTKITVQMVGTIFVFITSTCISLMSPNKAIPILHLINYHIGKIVLDKLQGKSNEFRFSFQKRDFKMI